MTNEQERNEMKSKLNEILHHDSKCIHTLSLWLQIMYEIIRWTHSIQYKQITNVAYSTYSFVCSHKKGCSCAKSENDANDFIDIQ